MDRNKQAREELNKKHHKSIMIYGANCLFSTGNSKLIYHLAKAFQLAGHKVNTIASEYNGHQVWYEGIPIFPDFYCEHCGIAHKGDANYIQKITKLINDLKPDYFICVGDPYLMQQFGLGNIDFKITKAIMLGTMDSKGIFCSRNLTDSGKIDYLDRCDKVISLSNFTQKQFKNWYDIESETIYQPVYFYNNPFKNVYKQITKEQKNPS